MCITLYYNVDIMSTALTIRTDPETKKKIAAFAASVGLSTSAFATAILLQAVREQRVLLTPTLEPTPYLEEIMRKAAADRKAGRNYETVNDEAELDDVFKDL
jgi:antitoxin component of RelBE/YafQ-DinJ toxin-antitoxin module